MLFYPYPVISAIARDIVDTVCVKPSALATQSGYNDKKKEEEENRSRKRGKLTLVINAAVPQVSFDNEKENTARVKRGTPGGACDLDLFT